MAFCSHQNPDEAAYLKMPPPSTPASSRPWALIMRTRNFCLRLGAGDKHYIKHKMNGTCNAAKAPFVSRKLVSGKGVTRVPVLLTYNSLENLANRLSEKPKGGLVRRLTHQPGHYFSMAGSPSKPGQLSSI